MLDDRLPVFLDTCAFSNVWFNTHSLQLASLESLVNKRLVRLVTTSIIVREAHAGISRMVKEAAGSYDKFMEEARILRALLKSPHQLPPRLPQEFEEDIRATFDDYLKRTGAAILETDDLRAGPIFDDYFALRPPFETKKKHEFPDAFSLLALSHWLKSNRPTSFAVVTDDDGFSRAVSPMTGAHCHTTLDGLLNDVHSRDEVKARFIRQEVLARRLEIRKWSADVFGDLTFHVQDHYDGEVLEVSVETVDMSDDPADLEIVDLESRTATITTPVDVRYVASLQYADEAAPSHVTRDGQPVYWGYYQEKVKESIETELEIQVAFMGLDALQVERIDFPNLDTIFVETDRDKQWRRDMAEH